MSKKAQQLAARYGRKSDIIEIAQDIINEQYHVNAFNFPKCPIITSSDEIQAFNWGLIPFWTKTEKDANEIKKMTLNARADSIFEKPSFREPIMKKRCIIPSTGYFEWRHEGSKKTDYIHNTKHRMPAILSKEDEERWLETDLSKTEISSLLKPYNANVMDAYVIDNNFIKKTGLKHK